MDYNDPSRQQYAHNSFSSRQQSRDVTRSQIPYTNPGSVEPFRQSAHVQQPASALPSTRRASHDAQVFGLPQNSPFGAGALGPVQSMQHAPDPQSVEIPRHSNIQQYGQYGAGVMYGIAQPTQLATQTSHDPVARYAARPVFASDTLGSQFGGAQPAEYYLAAPTSAAIPDLPAFHMPTQYQPAYAQPGPSASYMDTAMLDPGQSTTYPGYTSQYSSSVSQSADQAFQDYQAKICTVCSKVRDQDLRDVGNLLLDCAHYLLGNVEALGLTRDDGSLHDQRIQLWDDFNRAWLITLQTQFDMAEDCINRDQTVQESRSLMTQQTLDALSRDLVRLCDGIEQHGLVDYQMGVAEEEIMDLLLRCLAQLDPDDSPSPGAGHELSSSPPPRAP